MHTCNVKKFILIDIYLNDFDGIARIHCRYYYWLKIEL